MLESMDPSVASVPPSVAFEEGWIAAAFDVTWVSAGSTQVKATLDGVDAWLDVSCPGVLPSTEPVLAKLRLVPLRPSVVVGKDTSARPDGEVGVPLVPSHGTGEAEPELVPKPKVGRGLRPKPSSAG